MSLNELYKRGTKLIREDGTTDVTPDFHGMSVKEFNRLQITAECDRQLKGKSAEDAPLSKKRLWHFRDDYGAKSL